MALGSIFTSSASGSWRRRAIDAAPRMDTSRSGSSSRATSLAEYTEAPASLTTTTCGDVRPRSRSVSRTSVSVSRDAVPLPIAMSSGVKRVTSVSSVAANRSP